MGAIFDVVLEGLSSHRDLQTCGQGHVSRPLRCSQEIVQVGFAKSQKMANYYLKAKFKVVNMTYSVNRFPIAILRVLHFLRILVQSGHIPHSETKFKADNIDQILSFENVSQPTVDASLQNICRCGRENHPTPRGHSVKQSIYQASFARMAIIS